MPITKKVAKKVLIVYLVLSLFIQPFFLLPEISAVPIYQINITNPINDSNVNKILNITTNGLNIGASKVEFYIDDKLKSTANSAPFSFFWNTSLVLYGPHTIKVVSYDRASNTSTDAVKVNVLSPRGEDSQKQWVNIGEGGGGGIWSAGFDATGNLWIGGDVGGLFKSSNPLSPEPLFQMSSNGLRNKEIYEIVGHPSNPDIIYVGTRGGPYKTTNGGKTWQNMRDLTWPTPSTSTYTAQIDTIALNPSNPENIWVGTGNSRRHKGGQSKIYVSNDGMNSWKTINLSTFFGGKTDVIIHKILFNPINPNQVFIGTSEGFLISGDSGNTWQIKNAGLPQNASTGQNPDAWDLAINPKWSNDPATQIIYATLYNIPQNKLISPTQGAFMGGIYKSSNLGQTWQSISGNVSQDSSLTKRYVNNTSNYQAISQYKNIIIDPDNPNIIYLQSPSYASQIFGGGLWKSIDGGGTWYRKSDSNTNSNFADTYENKGWKKDLNLVNSADSAWFAIMHPLNNNYLYFGSMATLFRSSDKAESFRQIASKQRAPGYFSTTGIEIGYNPYIKVDPQNENNLYMPHASDYGIFRNFDFNLKKNYGYNWKMNPNNELLPRHWGSSDLEIDPKNPNIVYAAIDGVGSGKSWNSAITKSTDKGQTFTPIHNPNLPVLDDANITVKITDIDIKYVNNNKVIYVAARPINKSPTKIGGVYKSTDDGTSWQNISPTSITKEADRKIYKISVSPFDPNTLYIAVGGYSSSSAGIYESTDGGINWNKISSSKIAFAVTVESDPNDPNILWTGTQQGPRKGGVWKGVKTGGVWNWTLTLDMGYKASYDIAIDPNNSNIVYAAGSRAVRKADDNMGTGLWRSLDKGNSWQQINEGLENSNLDVTKINIDPHNSKRIYIGTGGNGAWVRNFKYDSASPKISILKPVNDANVFGSIFISASATADVGILKVEFYLDNKLINIQTSAKDSSNYSFFWDSRTVANGIHSLKAKAYDANGNSTETQNINLTIFNNPPILSPIANQTIREGGTLTFKLNATSPNNDILTYSATDLPKGATLIGNTFKWTPNYNQAGIYKLTFKVSNGILTTSKNTVITVLDADTKPPEFANIGINNSFYYRGKVSIPVKVIDTSLNSIKLYYNNKEVSKTIYSPYTFFWNSRSFNGTQILTLKAIDKAGNQSRQDIKLKIDNYLPRTYAKKLTVKKISNKKAQRYLLLYKRNKKKYRKAKNHKARKYYKKKANKYKSLFIKAKKRTYTTNLKWKVKDPYTGNKAKVSLKIQRRIKSKTRARKKAHYLKYYKVYRKKYKRNKSLKRQRFYFKKARRYKKIYRKISVYVYKTVKNARYGWTSINKWRSYKLRISKSTKYKYFVYAQDKAGNNQLRIAKGILIVK